MEIPLIRLTKISWFMELVFVSLAQLFEWGNTFHGASGASSRKSGCGTAEKSSE